MNENVFKYLAIFFFIIVIWSFCSGPDERSDAYYDVNVQTLVPASDGLNLKAVGELLKKAKTNIFTKFSPHIRSLVVLIFM